MPQELAQGWCQEKDIPYFEVSAKSDINVVQAFEMLASRALARVSRHGGSTCWGWPPGWGWQEPAEESVLAQVGMLMPWLTSC